MYNTLRKLYVIPILAVMLMAACSEPSQDAASSNSNAAQSPGSGQPSIAQNGTPTTTNNANVPVAVMPVPPPQASDRQPPVQPAAQPAAKEAGAKTPKLVAPSKTIEFGKQPKDKTLMRSFQIRNTGSAVLNIEDVHPG